MEILHFSCNNVSRVGMLEVNIFVFVMFVHCTKAQKEMYEVVLSSITAAKNCFWSTRKCLPAQAQGAR